MSSGSGGCIWSQRDGCVYVTGILCTPQCETVRDRCLCRVTQALQRSSWRSRRRRSRWLRGGGRGDGDAAVGPGSLTDGGCKSEVAAAPRQPARMIYTRPGGFTAFQRRTQPAHAACISLAGLWWGAQLGHAGSWWSWRPWCGHTMWPHVDEEPGRAGWSDVGWFRRSGQPSSLWLARDWSKACDLHTA